MFRTMALLTAAALAAFPANGARTPYHLRGLTDSCEENCIVQCDPDAPAYPAVYQDFVGSKDIIVGGDTDVQYMSLAFSGGTNYRLSRQQSTSFCG